jgi:photosystem II stability/assembly factor-like uncharacterized protein
MGTGSETLILGTRKGLFILRRGGGSWEVARVEQLGLAIAYATLDPRSGTLWSCMAHEHWGQKLDRSRDGGATWEKVATPKYPEDAVIYEAWPGSGERPVKPATLRYLWVLEPGGADQPGVLYIGTEPGGLFRTEDDGDTWQLVEGLWNHPSRLPLWMGGGRDYAGIHSIIVDPRASRRVLAGISCAGVFETTDGGETWTPRNRGLKAEFLPDPDVEVGHDVHFMDACAGQPDVLWQQNHCGIFRSTDGARSWQAVSARGQIAHFGFPIAADPEDPETAWVVPGASDEQRVPIEGGLCVCRTEDGGHTWTALRQGLPQVNCYDLVLRHALDQSGDRVAFGSTTGNVFLSEDRGDSWTCLGHHFPPVYSVRFAPA